MRTSSSSSAWPTPPLVTVDAVVFTRTERRLQVYLLQRSQEPFAGDWALPGGMVHPQEDADAAEAAQRVLRDKTPVVPAHMEQLYTFAGGQRDPRGWSVAVAYVGLAAPELDRRGDQETGRWWPVDDLPALAFDHAHIIQQGVERIRSKASYSPWPLWLLDTTFTLKDVWELYQDILGTELDQAAFRRKMLAQELIVDSGEQRSGPSGRPAQLYTWNKQMDGFRRPWPVVKFR
jgi:8-oxo-dGTP diphosphatase